jgi:hypothetical protein
MVARQRRAPSLAWSRRQEVFEATVAVGFCFSFEKTSFNFLHTRFRTFLSVTRRSKDTVSDVFGRKQRDGDDSRRVLNEPCTFLTEKLLII